MLQLWRRPTARLPSSVHLDEAIASDQLALNENPDDLKALTDLGLRNYLKGPSAYTESINELEQARDMGALDARIFYCLGIMYQSLGLYPFAIENYQRYLRNNPDDEETALLEAKLLYQSGRFQDAFNEYRRLKSQDPNNAVLAENLALSLWKMNRLQEALSELARMGGLGTAALGRVAFDSAQIDFDMKRFSDAMDNLTKAQRALGPEPDEIAPENFYRLMAKTSQKLGDPEKALNAWNQVLASDPQDREARHARRLLLRQVSARKRLLPQQPKSVKP